MPAQRIVVFERIERAVERARQGLGAGRIGEMAEIGGRWEAPAVELATDTIHATGDDRRCQQIRVRRPIGRAQLQSSQAGDRVRIGGP